MSNSFYQKRYCLTKKQEEKVEPRGGSCLKNITVK